MAAVLPATPYTPRRRSFGVRSSARFFYLVDAIGRLSEPTATQLASLDSSYRSTGEYLAECPEFKGLMHEVHAHGSRQIGTLVRPVDESREGFDIDLIARLNQSAMRVGRLPGREASWAAVARRCPCAPCSSRR